jgi:hypothetical protein
LRSSYALKEPLVSAFQRDSGKGDEGCDFKRIYQKDGPFMGVKLSFPGYFYQVRFCVDPKLLS